MKNLLIALGIIIALAPINSFAGKLDDFEKAATKKKHERPQHGGHRQPRENRDNGHHTNGGCHGFLSCLFEIFIHVDASSPSTDPHDAAEHPEDYPEDAPRRDNPSNNSNLTVDVAYQGIDPTIFGLDSSIKLRFKFIHIEGRFTRFVETSPYDTLDVIQTSLVFPIKLSRSLTVGGSVGLYQLAGNNINTGVSFGAPISYRARGSRWGFSMTPTWASINGNMTSDIDFRVNYRNRVTNFFAGHRSLNTGTVILSGPYLGMGLNF